MRFIMIEGGGVKRVEATVIPPLTQLSVFCEGELFPLF